MQELAGGAANEGRVLRDGDTVRRPLPPNARTLHALLRDLRAASSVEAPLPLSADGEVEVEVVEYLPGDVALAPYPAWVSTESALTSVARLLRNLHDATAAWSPPSDASWSPSFADPRGGTVICHNDVCIENVVFRDGSAAALLDFDFAAPGRRVWDVVMTARYWVPLTDPDLPAAADRGIDDPIGRLRRFVDAYGLAADERRVVVDVLLDAEEVARRYVESQASRGVAAFMAMWDADARDRFDRKLDWIQTNSGAITSALI